ncbi:MAG: glycosyltransferase family 4 protein [Bacteroidetes bacterium]|nr:glycosyltransferase family 4 protein [Bacteroidota bacterium]
MTVGYWVPNKYVTSVQIYTENVIRRLEDKGYTFIAFRSGDKLPEEVDVYWDSTCTGGKYPNKRLLPAKKPVLVTVHGAAPMALPLRFTYNGKKKQFKGWFQNQKKKLGWQSMGHKVNHIITVSKYAEDEIRENLPLRNIPIHVIYHGFDHRHFSPLADTDWQERDPFFFHISVYQPKKNIEAIIKAYRGIPDELKKPLKISAPGYQETINENGLTVGNQFVDQKVLAEDMRTASGFIFPSLHESFGLPILEAMASGCPVLTSNITSCDEIGGDAALKVDPHSVEDIRRGMIELFGNADLRMELRKKGLERAKAFSWEICADNHAKVFQVAKLQTV